MNRWDQCRLLYHGLGGGPDPYRSRIPASIARQSRFPNFCHLFPQYRFLSQYRLQCQDFGGSKFPRSGEIPFPVKKFCVFPNPVLYFGPRVITRSRKRQEEKLFLGLGEKTHCLRLFWPPDSKKKQIMNSFIHHHYLLCVNGTLISRVFKVMCEWVKFLWSFVLLQVICSRPKLGVINDEVYF